MADDTEKIEFPQDGDILDNPDGKEVVVHDFDDDGNLTGWHKEPLKGEDK